MIFVEGSTEVGNEVASGNGPEGVAVDPSGRFAFVCDNDSVDVVTFQIDATTGAPTKVGSSVATGAFAAAVVVAGFDE